ncbi:WD40 repeat domain-containing serine/threonine protein kinase [Actinomadura sp. 6N118]|uniref:WD40 repeat domain-containing serine/threonine protein kinase n=1 Tax=Actinomadura sp. 6N118 TaxID=3375151 RepID=UPI00379C7FA1
MDPLQGGDPRQVGTYRLLGRLGGGGMGQVFAGRSRGGRLVAVKLVRPELAGDAGFRRRFAQEVAAARRVGGFYTAQVVDADPGADPPWLVTAYVPGPSLQQAVHEHGPLPAAALGVLGAGLAEGLDAIHGAGLVHRDLKPGNIILAADGPRVIDFGIARAMDAAHTSTAVLGTPGFMSPEQARGQQVGPASDVFALGSVLTFAATGNGPFGMGSVEAVVYRVVHAEPELTGVPSHIAAVVIACLAKDPGQRPSLREILDRLAVPHAGGGPWLPPAVTTMVSTYERTTRPPGWHPSRRAFVVGGLSTAAVASIPVVALLNSPPAGAGKPRASATSLPAVLLEGDGEMRSVTFSPDSGLLAGVGDDGRTRLWKVASRTPAGTFTHKVVNPWSKPLSAVTSFNPEFRSARSTAFSPDGARLAVGNGDGTISLWDVATGDVTTLPYLDPVEWDGALSAVAINPVNGTLASTYDAPAVRLWDLAARSSIATLTTGDGYWAAALAFNPSGDVLATASGNDIPGNKSTDGRLQLWDASSRTNIATLAHTNSNVNSLAFSPDGKTLANLCNDGTITLWDVAARTRTATLSGAGSGVTCIAFGKGGVLAGGFNDGTITLWDVAARKSIASLSTGTRINCVAVSPDGTTVAAGGKRLTVWTMK